MITQGLEDYLELIYNSVLQNKNLRAIDIANSFKISRASVSEALLRLVDLKLITYKNRSIELTPQGIKKAQKIVKKHKVLFEFFHEILGCEYESSYDNACRIEHFIDNDTLKKINDFNKFCLKESVSKKFKKETHDK